MTQRKYQVESRHSRFPKLNRTITVVVQDRDNGKRNVIGDAIGCSRDYQCETDIDAIHLALSEHGARCLKETLIP